MNPSVSVIIPVYNNAAYLEDCLRSLAVQGMADFEALLMDDGSSDESPDILRRWQAEDGRFSAHFLPHGGVSAARNAGIAQAQGDYLFMLDADDLLPENSLSSLLAAAGDADIVCAWHEEFDPDGTRRLYRPDCPPMPTRRAARRIIEGDSVYNITCNKLFRRKFWQAQGLSYDKELRIGEDALVSLRAFLAVQCAVLVPEITYCYRIHPTSAMRAGEGEYDRHLPFFRAVRRWLVDAGQLPAFQGDLAAAVALRYYKQYGLQALYKRFGAEVERELLPASAGFSGWLLRQGWYPAWYVCTFPLRRVRWLLRRLKGGWKR